MCPQLLLFQHTCFIESFRSLKTTQLSCDSFSSQPWCRKSEILHLIAPARVTPSRMSEQSILKIRAVSKCQAITIVSLWLITVFLLSKRLCFACCFVSVFQRFFNHLQRFHFLYFKDFFKVFLFFMETVFLDPVLVHSEKMKSQESGKSLESAGFCPDTGKDCPAQSKINGSRWTPLANWE